MRFVTRLGKGPILERAGRLRHKSLTPSLGLPDVPAWSLSQETVGLRFFGHVEIPTILGTARALARSRESSPGSHWIGHNGLKPRRRIIATDSPMTGRFAAGWRIVSGADPWALAGIRYSERQRMVLESRSGEWCLILDLLLPLRECLYMWSSAGSAPGLLTFVK